MKSRPSGAWTMPLLARIGALRGRQPFAEQRHSLVAAVGVRVTQLAERAAVQQQQARAAPEHAGDLPQRLLLVRENQRGLLRQPVAVKVA